MVVRKEKTVKEVSKLFADRYKEPVEVYEKVFLNVLVQEGIKVIPNQKLHEVVGEEFANKIIEASKQISENLKKYSKGELKVSELIENLKPQLTDIGFDVLDAHGYDKEQLVALQDAFMQANWLMVSEIAFTEVYKILKQVDEQAELQHEHRVLVQQECEKSIALMRQYREDLNVYVSNYISERMEVFEQGISIMDSAILNNDTNGYIKGNIEIQKMLNYHVQFTNEDEFDDFMNSDDAFVL